MEDAKDKRHMWREAAMWSYSRERKNAAINIYKKWGINAKKKNFFILSLNIAYFQAKPIGI